MGLKWIPCFGLSISNLSNLTIPAGPILAALDLPDRTNISTINRTTTKNATTFSWMTKISHPLVILDNTTIHTIHTHLPPPLPHPSINSHTSPPLPTSTSNFPAGGLSIFSLRRPGQFLRGTAPAFTNSCGC